MKKYLVRFTTKSGDYDKEWCYANSELDAEEKIQHEHWNIERIDSVTEL
jgi:type II secretory pathway component PulF